MKLIIDIPDDVYEYIKGLNEGITDYHTTVKLYRAVRNGEVIKSSVDIHTWEWINERRELIKKVRGKEE